MPLTAWANFYVVVGSSAAALTGLMFVAVSLIQDAGTGSTGESISAFGTPPVVHFCAALLISVVLCAPWPAMSQVAVTLGLIGVAGVSYVAIVLGRARRQSEYQPVFADWLWHTLLPFVAYGALFVSSLVLAGASGALFGTAAATLLLLFIGIHNAWDTVTYIAFLRLARGRAANQPTPAADVAPTGPAAAVPDGPPPDR
jgi:hypothetical protein